MKKMIFFALVALCASGSAYAHPGHGLESGFAAGLMHPLTGWDHLLVMFALGIWAARQPQGQGWPLPVTFVLAMAIAAFSAMAWMSVSLAEFLVAASVVVMGGLLLADLKLSRSVQLAGVAVMAAVHGYLHGMELGNQWAALAGMVMATAWLHGLGWWLGHKQQAWLRTATQWLGGGMMVLGAYWFMA